MTIADNRVLDPATSLEPLEVSNGHSIVGNPRMGATVVAGDGPLCSAYGGSGTSLGHNLVEDATCLVGTATASDHLDRPASLSVLAANGGPTATHLPGSGLVDVVPPSDLLCSSLLDQRGGARPVGTGCDIGAVELRAGDTAPLVLSSRAIPGARLNEP